MKITELMIGDWVHNSYHKQNIQWWYSDMICPNGLIVTGRDIKPIPLTPEILEKNGFGFTRNNDTKSVWNGYWIYENLELGTCCLDREGNWPCFINIDDMNIKCEYVHQLQHTLRLCKLGDLADNFKV